MAWALPSSASRRSVARKSVSSVPTRHTSSNASEPGVAAITRWRKSFMPATALPFMPTTMSPKRTPACAAGPPAVTPRMSAPLPSLSPTERASGSSTGSICTPSQPFSPSVGWLPILAAMRSTRPRAGVTCFDGTTLSLSSRGGVTRPTRGGMRTMLMPWSATLWTMLASPPARTPSTGMPAWAGTAPDSQPARPTAPIAEVVAKLRRMGWNPFILTVAGGPNRGRRAPTDPTPALPRAGQRADPRHPGEAAAATTRARTYQQTPAAPKLRRGSAGDGCGHAGIRPARPPRNAEPALDRLRRWCQYFLHALHNREADDDPAHLPPYRARPSPAGGARRERLPHRGGADAATGTRPGAGARHLSVARSLHARAHARPGPLRAPSRHRGGHDRRHGGRGGGLAEPCLQGRRHRRGAPGLAGVRPEQRRRAAQDRSVSGPHLHRQRRARHARHDRLLRALRGRPAQGRRDGGGVGGLRRRGPG